MSRDVLFGQVHQLHEDACMLMPIVSSMSGHLLLLGQHYDALLEEVAKLIPENERDTLPPRTSDNTPLAYSMVEIALFSGQLLAILREA